MCLSFSLLSSPRRIWSNFLHERRHTHGFILLTRCVGRLSDLTLLLAIFCKRLGELDLSTLILLHSVGTRNDLHSWLDLLCRLGKLLGIEHLLLLFQILLTSIRLQESYLLLCQLVSQIMVTIALLILEKRTSFVPWHFVSISSHVMPARRHLLIVVAVIPILLSHSYTLSFVEAKITLFLNHLRFPQIMWALIWYFLLMSCQRSSSVLLIFNCILMRTLLSHQIICIVFKVIFIIKEHH